MQDLMSELHNKTIELDDKVKELAKLGCEYAESEKNYRMALRKECLSLRAQGYAVGMIDKICYGGVAEERLERDCAEAIYKSAREAVNVLKLQVRLLNDQIEREYHA